MKPQMKLVLAVAAVWAGCLSAPAAMYNVDGTTMAVQKNNVYYIDTFFQPVATVNEVTINPLDDIGYPYYTQWGKNREAFVWTAPLGQFITQIDFLENYNGITGVFRPVIYDLSGTSLATGTATLWQAPDVTGLHYYVPRTTTFGAGITSVGFGFDVYPIAESPVPADWYVGFSSMVITTVPEPASLGLLAVGGMLLLGRQRARR